MDRGAHARTAAVQIFPYSVHASARAQPHHDGQPQGDVQTALRSVIGHAQHFRPRPQAFGRTGGHHQRAAHVGPAAQLPPARALHRDGPRVGQKKSRVGGGQKAAPAFPRAGDGDRLRSLLHQAAEGDESKWRDHLERRTEIGMGRVAAGGEAQAVGGVCQAAFWRARAGGGIPGPLHAQGRHQQQPHKRC